MGHLVVLRIWPFVVLALGTVACDRQAQSLPAQKQGSLPPAGQRAGAERSAAASEETASSSQQAAEQHVEFSVAGSVLRLRGSAGESCELRYHVGLAGSRAPQPEQPWKTLRLALHGPCHVVRWQGPPPTSVESVGEQVEPVGTSGAPQAYRFIAPAAATVVALVGDPLSASEFQTLFGHTPAAVQEQLASRPCGKRLQGVVIRKASVELRGPSEAGHVCADQPLDFKDFWLLARSTGE